MLSPISLRPFSISIKRQKGGLLFRSPLNTFFISLICAPPSPRSVPSGYWESLSQCALRSGVQVEGSEHVEVARKRRRKRKQRVETGLRTGSSLLLPETLKLKAFCMCVRVWLCVYHSPNQRLQGRFMPLPFSRPPLHQLIYTHYRI